MKINRQLSEKLFPIMTGDELDRWIRDVEKDIGGVIWNPLGGRDNNSHTVEVATDPALALVERPTNCIDAMLDLKAETLGETAETPHAAAAKWFNVPADGLSGLSEEARRQLADNIQVSMLESGRNSRDLSKASAACRAVATTDSTGSRARTRSTASYLKTMPRM